MMARAEAAVLVMRLRPFAAKAVAVLYMPPLVIAHVVEVVSGFAGGPEKSPSYKDVSAGRTGHAEAVKVVFDPARVRYEELLEVYWRQIDPTQVNGQFADKGSQYRTAIFYLSEEQRRLAESSKERLAASGKFDQPIATEIAPATPFYPAEDYHQDYYKKHPLRYKLYRTGSGRAGYLKRTWND